MSVIPFSSDIALGVGYPDDGGAEDRTWGAIPAGRLQQDGAIGSLFIAHRHFEGCLLAAPHARRLNASLCVPVDDGLAGILAPGDLHRLRGIVVNQHDMRLANRLLGSTGLDQNALPGKGSREVNLWAVARALHVIQRLY